MPRPLVLLRAALLAGAVLSLGVQARILWRKAEPPRNVILITIDTLRADRLSSYGYWRSQTPNMDRLADEGMRFALAYCDIPWTTGSLASTMTSTLGPRHGVKTFTNKLPTDSLTLAEILHANGFRTGAVLASFATDRAYQLDQGFEHYDDELDTPVFLKPGKAVETVDLESEGETLDRETVNEKIANEGYRSDASVTDAAIAMLDSMKGGRFFLWVHYFGPHERFVLDPGVNHHQRVIDDYDPQTRATDVEVGRFLDGLDDRELADDTLVVLHSDHGQAFREHGLFGHGHDLHEESMRIPILMRLPRRIEAGRVSEALVRNVDLMPTILDYVGIEVAAGLDGRSLRPMIRGDKMPDVPAYMELVDAQPLPVPMLPAGIFYASSTWHGLRMGPWKYLNVRLHSPCVKNPKKYKPFGKLDVNPKQPLDGEPVPDADCGKPLRQDLYAVGPETYVVEDLTSNRIVKHKDVATRLATQTRKIEEARGRGENLTLDSEQERKLRSLGYLR